jgi:S1-C subfamily serine protease
MSTRNLNHRGHRGSQRKLQFAILPLSVFLCALCVLCGKSSASLADVVARVQPKIVKIYGAGGPSGLEPYQSGVLISENGHVLTAWSYVLDTDEIDVTLNDGRKFTGKLVGADVRTEIAVLKIDAAGLEHFKLDQAATIDVGARVLALSNLYGVATGNEAASVQHGVVAARTTLAARRGVYNSPYQGPVYVLDAMTNNPGAAGGAVVNVRGELVGVLGKELRHARTGTWLNYALPIAELRSSVTDILAGKTPRRDDMAKRKPREPHQLRQLGIELVPDVLEKTPPFVDQVRAGSPAAKAAVRPDDLVLLVADRLVGSCRAAEDELSYIDRIDPVRLTLLRGQQVVEVTLRAGEEAKP